MASAGRNLDQLYGECRAEARRTPQRGYSIDPKLLLLSVMVDAAVALGSIVGEPSRPFKGGRAYTDVVLAETPPRFTPSPGIPRRAPQAARS